MWNLTRRATLRLAAAAAAMLPFGARPRAEGHLWFGTRLDAQGGAHATAFDAEGRPVIDLPLPARGHGIAVSPDRKIAVVMGRRPGRFALALNLADGSVAAQFAPSEGCDFCGHAVFSADGRLLYATETDWEGERGLVGVYDAAAGFARVAAWESGGLDPHDVRLLPGDGRIVVANGGILTHPDAPGAKLNLEDMDSSLAVLSLADGSIERHFRLEPGLFQLSIRHLVVGRDGTVGFVMQYEGPAERLVPLGGLLRPDGTLQLLEMPRDGLADLRQYCGSAAADAAGETFGMTSPRGGSAAFFRFSDGGYLGSRGLSDVCAIAADPALAGGFYIAGGHGGIERVSPSVRAEVLQGDLARTALWDNHMALA
ncbi:DUF1513 domain-containing protein [Zavarzinia sp.]|uniref:DUF1513 domain-containing protein n=1 Tax=Zavarzinia sp. TaxID=2027920 RepID=UPI00356461CA